MEEEEIYQEEQPISKKDALKKRLGEKYPDKSFDEDEDFYGQITDDYDASDAAIADYQGREKRLADMLDTNPKSAQFIADMASGKDPIVGLIENFGLEIRDVLDDPEKQEEIAEANTKYIEKIAKDKELEEEFQRNFAASMDELSAMQQEQGLTDDQCDRVMEFIIDLVGKGVMGQYDRSAFEMALKAINYDNDVASATENGQIAGRNAKIEETLRKSNKGDGTAALNGKNNSTANKGDYGFFSAAMQA